ncbi:MAG TPA: hypothetical protein VMU68_08650 [Acidimicrobiales bacterium]|nr:hypothetical protein [Acidimicrobiales bacterium]
MSVISFPRRVDTQRPRPDVRPRTRPTARPDVRRRPTHEAVAPRRRAITGTWRRASSLRRSCIVVIIALALSMAGSMLVANRQVQLHSLQSQLLQAQSTYAEQVGSNTNLAAPSLIATKAGALHLVYPVSVTQVPSTSLDEPLRLPKFLGYAPATSRTIR